MSEITCRVPKCMRVFSDKRGYASHLRAHLRRGEISEEQYKRLLSPDDDQVVVSGRRVRYLEAEASRWKAEASRWKRMAEGYERQLDIVARIEDVVRGGLDAGGIVQPPQLYVPERAEGEETAVLLMSDVHIGKLSPTYNAEVFVVRLERLMKSMMSIVSAQRTVRAIRKLIIVLNGDIVDAESVYPSQAVEKICAVVLDQIYTHAVPALTHFLLFCLKNFEEVEIHAVRGNHGRQNAAKWTSSRSTNWDLVLYKTLQVATRDQPRLKWNIYEKDWKALFEVQGYGFLATHGDMIRVYYNLPLP